MRLLPPSQWILTFASFAALISSPPAEARQKRSVANQIMDSVTASVDTALTTAVMKEPQDQEVCFSPDERCDLKLQKLIESAKKSIDIAIFDINLDAIVHQLLIASKKIPVRIVADKRQAKGNHSLVPLLIKAGAQVRYGRQRGIMHHKFTLVDGKMLETGSFNYTNHASKANHENQVYLANPTLLKRYQEHFEGLWQIAKPALESP